MRRMGAGPRSFWARRSVSGHRDGLSAVRRRGGSRRGLVRSRSRVRGHHHRRERRRCRAVCLVRFSWGGVVGLQLAARTDRLSALICGGWPPLGASYRDMTRSSEWLAHRAGAPAAELMVTFYRALNEWRDEEAVSKFACPRMAFAGSDDVITTGGYTTRIGPLVAERRADLERLGWSVRLVDKAPARPVHAAGSGRAPLARVLGSDPAQELGRLSHAIESAGRGPVLGWRLPMEQTDIEIHEIESSRRITATPGARSAPKQTLSNEPRATMIGPALVRSA